MIKLKDRLVKFFFNGVIEEEIRKSSRQIVSHVMGLSSSEGILPDVDFEIFNFSQALSKSFCRLSTVSINCFSCRFKKSSRLTSESILFEFESC